MQPPDVVGLVVVKDVGDVSPMETVSKNGGTPHRVHVDGFSFGRFCRVHAHASEELVEAPTRLLMR